MAITVNGNSSFPQPQTLREELVQIQTENMSIAGNMQRNRINQKKQATLTYEMLSAADYQTAIAAFTTGSGVTYSNNLSKYTGGTFAFSGLPYFTEDDYVAGASLQSGFTVRIREQ